MRGASQALATVAGLVLGAHALAATLTLNVTVPASTPPGDAIHVAGDFQGWNPGDPAFALTDLGGGVHTITLTLPDGVPIQFKMTRGDWGRVEKGPTGEEIPNRTHTPVGTQALDLTVASWADIAPSTITGHVETFGHAPFLGGRRVWVYLPPGYSDTDDRYPVLYMHDGQNLFDQATSFAGEWRVDEAAEQLIGAGEIEPVIIVGIDNGGAARCFEYTPFFDPILACSGGGHGYLEQVRDVLLPEIDARYRTRTGPAYTFMSGSSLGGLISTYAAYAFPDVWGRVASVSPAYWPNTAIFAFATSAGRAPAFERFYQDMGTGEGGSAIPNMRTMRDIALAQGFVLGDDLAHVEAAGHEHNEFYWAQRFPDILRFLIDAPAPGCAGDVNGDGATDVFDFSDLAAGFGAGPGATRAQGDLTGDGRVDVFDFGVLASDIGCGVD
jgi:predicted alpha/beta superfamily hydrolase